MRPFAAPPPYGGLLLVAAAAVGSAPVSGAVARLRSGPAGSDGSDLRLSQEIRAFGRRYPVTRFDWDRWEQAAQVVDLDGAIRKLPVFLDRFDWIASEKSIVHQKGGDVDPTVVYCNDSLGSVRALLVNLEQHGGKYLRAEKKRRVLVISGGYTWMSENIARIPDNPYWWPPPAVPLRSDINQVYRAVESYHQQRELPSSRKRLELEYQRLATWFQVVFVENKDVDFPNVRTLPAGFSETRLRQGNAARAREAVDTIEVANEPVYKARKVLYLGRAISDVVHECGSGWGEPQLWRDQLANWTQTDAALEAGVVTVKVRPQLWWDKLAAYRFLLAPPSCEVQSPAIVEALLVLTVPIVRRGPYAAYTDLVQYGFPIVVVHELDDIKVDMLEEKWKKLSPRLLNFRSKCLTTDAYWRLITGVFDEQDECWPALD
mmetsp:Transcript_106782/g.278819  ORF Transcript_106782/g.278819 Transcript_106782/m.278819 type:complete len:432 (-) Transcript_106782:96-1391(-)